MSGIIGIVQRETLAQVITFPVWGLCAAAGLISAAGSLAVVAALCAVGYLLFGVGWVLAIIGKAAWPVIKPVWQLLKAVVVFLWPVLFRPFLLLVTLPFWGTWWILSTIVPTFRYLRARRRKRRARPQSTNIGRDNGQAEATVDDMLLDNGLSMELATQPPPPGGRKHMHLFKLTQWEPWLEATMLVTCEPGSKSSCWACGIQICAGCVRTAQCEAPRTAQHFELCAPQCSRCYFQRECRKPRSHPKTTCALHPRPYAWQKEPSAMVEVRRVCLPCAALTPQRRRETREALEVEELRHLSRSNLKCKSCSRKIAKSGPRWWTCRCGMECQSEYHPTWGLADV